jgi:hypothetical protein
MPTLHESVRTYVNTKRLVWPLILLMLLCACERDGRHDRYKVITRTNINGDLVLSVPVVLEHDGHKYYAQCNNVKAVEDPKVTKQCDLHVGMMVECQLFKNREVNGYDLICGSRRNQKGDLDTYGDNELLQIDREEN